MIPSLVLAAMLAAPGDYVRSRAIPTGAPFDPKAHCLWWKNGTQIQYSVQQDGEPEITRTPDEFDAIDAAFGSWTRVLEAHSDLRFVKGPRISDRTIGFDQQSSTNTNSVVFRARTCSSLVGRSDGCWTTGTCQNKYDCWEYSDGTIALTTTTFDRFGVIYDSDIELNSARYYFTTVDSPRCVRPLFNQGCVATDVQNTMTHEIGHLLGLDHSTAKFCRNGGPVASCPADQLILSTMTDSAGDGETYKREIDPGSEEFIRTVYPKGQVSRDCVVEVVDSVKRALDGGTAGTYDCCGLGRPHAGCSAADGLLPAAAALLVARLASRRRRRSGPSGGAA